MSSEARRYGGPRPKCDDRRTTENWSRANKTKIWCNEYRSYNTYNESNTWCLILLLTYLHPSVLARSFGEARNEMFHELASLTPDSGSGIWTATEVTLPQVKVEILRFGSAGIEFVRCNGMCSSIDVGLMHSQVWIGLWMEDDGSSGVVTDVAVSALPRWVAAPRPRYL